MTTHKPFKNLSLQAQINCVLHNNLKPGDTFYPAGGANPLVVKKVNKISVTADSGTLWNFSEIYVEADRMRLWLAAAKCVACGEHVFTMTMNQHAATECEGVKL